jgi:hypothetical protein
LIRASVFGKQFLAFKGRFFPRMYTNLAERERGSEGERERSWRK